MNDPTRGLSRRDFLKLSGLGLLGLLFPGHPLSFFFDPSTNSGQSPALGPTVSATLQGRIAMGMLWSYDTPSPKGKRVKMYWRDLIVNIVGTAIDEDTTAYNRIWYQLENDSYLYSGWVQPVRTVLNDPVSTFSQDGLLGEVSVPFTDAYESPNFNAKVKYRLYYETTHWALESALGPDGSIWYRLLDDKSKKSYFVPARHIRIIPATELSPLSPEIPGKDKRIEVRLDMQLVLAYEAERSMRRALRQAAFTASGSTPPRLACLTPSINDPAATWPPVISLPAVSTCPACRGCSTLPTVGSPSMGHTGTTTLAGRVRMVASTFHLPPPNGSTAGPCRQWPPKNNMPSSAPLQLPLAKVACPPSATLRGSCGGLRSTKPKHSVSPEIQSFQSPADFRLSTILSIAFLAYLC
jgi:hypothetical protein